MGRSGVPYVEGALFVAGSDWTTRIVAFVAGRFGEMLRRTATRKVPSGTLMRSLSAGPTEVLVLNRRQWFPICLSTLTL